LKECHENGEKNGTSDVPRGTLRLSDPDGLAQYPELLKILQPRYKGDKLIAAGATVQLRASGGVYVARLNWETEGIEGVVVCDAIDQVWAEIEKALATNRLALTPNFASRKKALERFAK
jgi:hypothetical protein